MLVIRIHTIKHFLQLKTFGTEMEAMGITIKELVKELKKSIRRRGICSHNVYFRADRPHLTRHHSLLPMIGQKPASMTGSKRKRDFDEGPDSMLIPSVDTRECEEILLGENDNESSCENPTGLLEG